MPAKQTDFFDVRMRGFRDRADVEDVLRLIDARVEALEHETVSTASACGRVLASDVRSEVAVPGFDRAAMDGYAVIAEETFGAGPYNPLELRIIGAAMPGRPFVGQIALGSAVRIMTGAPMPPGADAVAPVETAEESADVVRIREAVSPGRHVGKQGEDVQPGKVVLRHGRELRPQDLGVLASIGVATVPVIRKPRVDILISGDELLPLGAKPEGCRIVDSNSVMLAALVHRDVGEANVLPLLPDRPEVVRKAIQESSADV